MARIYLNNVKTKLTAALTVGGGTCTVTAGDGALFAAATGGDYIRATLVKVSGYKEIDWEIVDITARSTDTLTITRAREGTTALAFAIGDVLDVRWTAEVPGSSTQAFETAALNVFGVETINLNSDTTLAAPTTGTVLHLASADSVATIQTFDAFGNANQIIHRRANGTSAAPTALLANQIIAQFATSGYGATAYSTPRNKMVVYASENWTDTAQGTYTRFSTTLDGATTNTAVMDLRSNGVVFANYGFADTLDMSATTATYTVPATSSSLIVNYAGTCTLTLPSASSYTHKKITIKTVTANAVVSASSNVTPLAGGVAGTAILSATAGKWVELQSDGTNWIIMKGN
jgi:hypothetical protein